MKRTREAQRVIRIADLSRIEGEAGFCVTMKGTEVEDVQLRVFEPPRLFEAFLRGRHYSEVPGLVARICGICPVAHQVTSLQAIESILGIEPDPAVVLLRRLLYLGEWIESHALHIFMLHAPDFLGHADAISLARENPHLVEQGLRLKKAGNALVRIIGGREIHPVTPAVCGFHRAPLPEELHSIVDELQWARDAAIECTRTVSRLEFPDFELPHEYMALCHPRQYAVLEGRLTTSSGEIIETRDFGVRIIEQQVKYSHALHSRLRDRGAYAVGVLSRINLSFAQLPEIARTVASDCGFAVPCHNPFRSIAARAIELIFACETALDLIAHYDQTPIAGPPATSRAGCGQSITEAPRGTLYHRYRLDEHGLVLEAQIVPPTAQNQKCMEDDIWQVAAKSAGLPAGQLSERCERAVRNYDPCISCATHCVVIRRK